jgi:hypothetical protein
MIQLEIVEARAYGRLTGSDLERMLRCVAKAKKHYRRITDQQLFEGLDSETIKEYLANR